MSIFPIFLFKKNTLKQQQNGCDTNDETGIR